MAAPRRRERRASTSPPAGARAPRGPTSSPPPPDDADEDDATENLQQALDRFVAKTNAEVHGLFEILGSKRRLMMINLLAGLSRGVGFFLGMTLVGGLVIGGTALVIDWTANVLGLKEISFRNMIEIFARKAAEAQDVWDVVREERNAVAEPAPPDGARDGGTGEPGEGR